MECMVRIGVLLTLLGLSTAQRKNEVFFVNVEEGFFGCQVNASSEFLQIFTISKLCDGVSDCYKGSDEDQKELKCSSKFNFNQKSTISKDPRASMQRWQCPIYNGTLISLIS